MRKLLIIVSSMALLFSLTGSALAASGRSKADAHSAHADNLPGPLATKQLALKSKAQEMVVNGQATARGDNQVVKVAKGQFVELAFEGEDQILTVNGEFGDTINPRPDLGGDPGPLHNEIPQPDRTVDNTTIWTADFSQEYYDNLLYNKGQVPSMANWYLAQSSGRYSVDGFVSDWVQVPYNEANYGANYCGGIVCARTWLFVRDSVNAWWAELVAEKGSVAAANAFLATFDVWDRYDHDGDGDFNEPDGYIDHFQSIHAGEGEETGGGAQGSDAIWSHRWYAFFNLIGSVGPADAPFGGLQIGGASGSNYWIGDYTIEPENGGVGVFAHEFGHDLGLPDLYDTSGNTGGAENGTGFWTEWSSGSYGSIDNEGIGTYPVSATAWERFQLGWLNYGVGFTGQKGSFRLGPVEANTKQLQGLFVVLPDKSVTQELGAPAAGTKFYYSGAADNLDTTMTRSVTLPAGASLSAKVRYNIEEGYDYAYLMVDGTKVSTNKSNSTVIPGGIEGASAGQPAWVDLTADLSAFTAGPHTIGFGYWTDGGVQGADGSLPAGFAVDEIAITGQPTDGAETDAGWTFASNQADQGFHVTSGTETFDFFNAYVAEFRQYRSYDKALQLGPYNFVDPAGTQGLPNWVEHFPYQDGLLIWYWDSSYADNNVGDHPGHGLLLPVDSHPNILHWSNGATARPRIQSYDATFGLSATDAISLHNYSAGITLTRSSQAAVPMFNDNLSYWRSGDPGDNGVSGRYQSEWNSVIVPHTGTTIRVVSISAQNSFMEVFVNK